jgi:hypothetical protein
MATIDITCTVPAPTLAQVRAWLTRSGWTVSTSWLDQAPHNERWSHPTHGSAWVPREELSDWLVYVSNWIANRAWQVESTPEVVYRDIVGPVTVYEAVTYDALGRTSLGFYVRRESAPQGVDVSIEEHEVQP